MANGLKAMVLVVGALALADALAFQAIPKASAKALGVTRGKSFSAGAVFVNGKYLPPPYVVERWGTGIRINSTPVTGQVIDWNEFLKTQSGVKVTKSELPAEASPSAAAPESAPPPAPVSVSTHVDASSLDDLFDDDPPAKKPSRASSVASAPRRPVAPPKPKVSVSYELEGGFVPNDGSKALLSRINAERTDIDRTLRSGGFICFGDRYARVMGDRRTFSDLLKTLPDLQRRSDSLAAFKSGVRAANLVYLNDILCEDLFGNRVDYLKLQERWSLFKQEQDLNSMIDSASGRQF